MTLPDLIAQLRAAAEAATKGEWRAEQRTLKHVVVFGSHRRPALSIVYGDSGDNIPNYGTEPEARANAAYIVAAQPQNILRLLAAYAEMERLVTEAHGCFVAARCEGWAEALTDGEPERINDLWQRRIAFAETAVEEALQQKDKADE